jgi:hypothetical protein
MDLNEFTILFLAHERLAEMRRAAQRAEYLRAVEPTPGQAWGTLRDLISRLTGAVRRRSAVASHSTAASHSPAASRSTTASPSTTRAA